MRNDAIARSSHDVVVVGARCAGAACAMLLGRLGIRVLLVDRGRYGTDTLSTHALMRAGVVQLHRWRVLDDVMAAGTPVVRRSSFHYGGEIIDVDIKPQPGIPGLYAPRRIVFDRILADAAREAGVEVSFETSLIGLTRSAKGQVVGATLKRSDGSTADVRARLVIGADGLRSRVAALVGANTYRTGRHSSGVVFSYWSGTSLEGYHWYYRPGVSAGAIETNDGQTCVFAAVPSRRFHDEIRRDVAAGHARILEECDTELAAAVARGRRVERYRGFAGRVGFFRRSWGPGWALVGDAGYFKDPLTAHGMTDALIDAELLALAAADGSDAALAGYQEARDERALGFFEATDSIAGFEWDLPTVQRLHRSLSTEMKRENAELAALHAGRRSFGPPESPS